MAVDTRVYGANVRSEPKFGASHIVGWLTQCAPVEITGEQVGDRWMPCRAFFNGQTREAYISKNVIRRVTTTVKENLMRVYVAEWDFFQRGKKKETEAGFDIRVGEYWNSIGLSYDGDDTHVPWSAAFISYAVRTAGGYDDFHFAAAHAKYTHQAIRNSIEGGDGPFYGYRITETKPQLGDMVCRARNGSGVTYDYAADHDAYQSHNDIVVRVTDDFVATIGGNVANSVSKTNYKLNSNGFIAGNRNEYCVMRNRR